MAQVMEAPVSSGSESGIGAVLARLTRELPRSSGTALSVIGEVEADGDGIRWVGPEGHAVTLGAGFEHFRG